MLIDDVSGYSDNTSAGEEESESYWEESRVAGTAENKMASIVVKACGMVWLVTKGLE